MTIHLAGPSHYLNQWCYIINSTLGNKLHWNSNGNLYIFIQVNVFEIVGKLAAILFRLQCVNYLTPNHTNKASEILVIIGSDHGIPTYDPPMTGPNLTYYQPCTQERKRILHLVCVLFNFFLCHMSLLSIFFPVTSLALGQSYDRLNACEGVKIYVNGLQGYTKNEKYDKSKTKHSKTAFVINGYKVWNIGLILFTNDSWHFHSYYSSLVLTVLECLHGLRKSMGNTQWCSVILQHLR